jgi:hypothetical protein
MASSQDVASWDVGHVRRVDVIRFSLVRVNKFAMQRAHRDESLSVGLQSKG